MIDGWMVPHENGAPMYLNGTSALSRGGVGMFDESIASSRIDVALQVDENMLSKIQHVRWQIPCLVVNKIVDCVSLYSHE